jgi:hypothetical protein
MFAELQTKEEQYLVDNGSYLTAAVCPATPSAQSQDASGCVGTGTPWKSMRVMLPTDKLYCTYEITAGASTVTPTVPTGFSMTTPATGWYFILATCDMDGSSTKNSAYFVSSMDTKVQPLNEGY